MSFQIIQVNNVAPPVTKDLLHSLFSIIGKVDDVQLYPEKTIIQEAINVKCSFVKFRDKEDASVALHLNSTVLVDKAIVITPFIDAENIPTEIEALQLASVASVVTAAVKFPRWDSNVTNTVIGIVPGAHIQTNDPKLEALGLPKYPALPAGTEPVKVDEIRRSVIAANLDDSVTGEQLLQFFSQAGEVMYVRLATEPGRSTRMAFVEFSHQSSVSTALSFSGNVLMGLPLRAKQIYPEVLEV